MGWPSGEQGCQWIGDALTAGVAWLVVVVGWVWLGVAGLWQWRPDGAGGLRPGMQRKRLPPRRQFFTSGKYALCCAQVSRR